jgi:hypothetical protein
MSDGKQATNLICPFMSCRVTQVDDPTNKVPTISPTIVRCQEAQCGIYDHGNKVCGVLSLSCEMIKAGEAV